VVAFYLATVVIHVKLNMIMFATSNFDQLIVEKMVHIPGWFDARQNKHNISEETAITRIQN
jgi:hypothetical protein